jgi:hypothetical protein
MLFSVAIFFLSGCGIPVPEDKRDYIGLWEAPNMSLLITQDGLVKYERIKRGASTKISGPIKEFQGDDFVVGLWFIKTTFRVNRRPYQEGSQLKMVVDGVELIRVNALGSPEFSI